MIILPDRNIPRAKFLIPVLDREWREPSQAVPRDQLGNPIQLTRFRIRAKTHDGVVLWTGWFEDRADFDAFLWSVALGTINQDKALWDLPTPYWPQLDPDLLYAADTITYLTSTSQTTYNKPSDWNNSSNYVDAIGAGSSGGTGSLSYAGGGGAWARTTNVSIVSSVDYKCGTVNGTTGSGTTPTTNSWFKDSSTLVAAGGGIGSTNGPAGAGGTTANSVGSSKFAGGNGNGGTNGPGGGGGAGGPNGAGGPGTMSQNVFYGGDGGAGNNGQTGGGTSGTGGAAYSNGGPGGNGTYYQASPAYGPGGGGGGSGFNTGTGGAGGNYGAAGGAGRNAAGVGKQGLIVVTYTPKPLIAGFNSPMLGM